MQLKLVKLSKKQIQEFRWRTMDGRILKLEEMKTSHIFNSMKMIFNHLAEEFKESPIWFNHKYSDYHQAAKQSPKQLAFIILIFITEIEARQDLNIKYKEPYEVIKR